MAQSRKITFVFFWTSTARPIRDTNQTDQQLSIAFPSQTTTVHTHNLQMLGTDILENPLLHVVTSDLSQFQHHSLSCQMQTAQPELPVMSQTSTDAESCQSTNDGSLTSTKTWKRRCRPDAWKASVAKGARASGLEYINRAVNWCL